MKKIVAVSMVAVLATTVFLSGCNTSEKNESFSDTPDSTTSSLSSDVKNDTIPQTTVESTNAVSSSSESSAGSKVSGTKYKHLVDYYNSDEMKSVINSADDAYNNDIYTLRITCEGNSIVYNFRMVQTYDGDAKDEMKSYLEKAMDSMNTSFKSVVDSINEVVEDDCTVIVRYKNGDGEVLSEKEFK